MRIADFQLYQNPRAATVRGESGVKTVLGIQIRDGERVFYLVADEDPKSTDSAINPHLVPSNTVSLFIGRG